MLRSSGLVIEKCARTTARCSHAVVLNCLVSGASSLCIGSKRLECEAPPSEVLNCIFTLRA